MTLGELLAAAGGSPLLLAIVVLGGFLLVAVERLAGVDGPLTRAFRAWQERELRRLRRQRALDAERRLAEPDRLAHLEEENARLRDEVARLRARPEEPTTEPIPGRSRRNSARRPPPPR